MSRDYIDDLRVRTIASSPSIPRRRCYRSTPMAWTSCEIPPPAPRSWPVSGAPCGSTATNCRCPTWTAASASHSLPPTAGADWGISSVSTAPGPGEGVHRRSVLQLHLPDRGNGRAGAGARSRPGAAGTALLLKSATARRRTIGRWNFAGRTCRRSWPTHWPICSKSPTMRASTWRPPISKDGQNWKRSWKSE